MNKIPYHHLKTNRASVAILVMMCIVILSRCESPQDAGDVPHTYIGESADIALSQRACGSCHQYVGPEMLDRVSWPRVLSVMRDKMGKVGMTLTTEEWARLRNFYTQNAEPVFYSVPAQSIPPIQCLFEREMVTHVEVSLACTMIEYVSSIDRIIVGTSAGRLYELGSAALIEICDIQNIPIDIDTISGDSLYLLTMGSLRPSNAPTGQLLRWSYDDCDASVIVDSLIRPIHFSVTDMDQVLISSFGSTVDTVATGGLLSIDMLASDESVIDELPGAMQTEPIEIAVGEQGVIGLFSQGNEMLKLYTWDDENIVQSRVLLSFSPVYGTNSFDLADVNGDGHLDILVTHGDNDDYSKIYKPYHGIRIYQNDGQFNFTEVHHTRINGASKVKAADFDLDGDMDFICLAMYPDLFNRAWESLLYFENLGDANFRMSRMTEEPQANWILMEVADIDSDGDMDIVTAANPNIGSAKPATLQQKWSESPVSLGVFTNTTLH